MKKTNKNNIVNYGYTGDCEWTLTQAGCLSIFPGKDGGFIGDYSDFDDFTPWFCIRNQVKSIVIMPGVKAGDSVSHLFSDLPALVSIEGLNYLDTSKTSSFEGMFENDTKLETRRFDLDTKNAINLGSMFSGCRSVKGLDLRFNTGRVKDFSAMFEDCEQLEWVNISKWNTSQARNMESMFAGCKSLSVPDFSSWDTSNVILFAGMFEGCRSFEELNINSFQTGNAADMGRMFCGCSALKNIDIGNFDTSNVKNFEMMFFGCTALRDIDLTKLDTSSAMNMVKMFANCRGLMKLNVNNFNTVADCRRAKMFENCPAMFTNEVTAYIKKCEDGRRK